MWSRIKTRIALVSYITLIVLSDASASTYDEALKDWAYVLESYVDEIGRTDFVALSTDRVRLDRFVRFVGTSGPSCASAAGGGRAPQRPTPPREFHRADLCLLPLDGDA